MFILSSSVKLSFEYESSKTWLSLLVYSRRRRLMEGSFASGESGGREGRESGLVKNWLTCLRFFFSGDSA